MRHDTIYNIIKSNTTDIEKLNDIFSVIWGRKGCMHVATTSCFVYHAINNTIDDYYINAIAYYKTPSVLKGRIGNIINYAYGRNYKWENNSYIPDHLKFTKLIDDAAEILYAKLNMEIDHLNYLRILEKEAEAHDASIRFTEFLESDVQDMVKFYGEKYPELSVNHERKMIQEYYPDLYDLHIARVDNTRHKHWAVFSSICDSLCDAIVDSKYKLSLLEFMRIYRMHDKNAFLKKVDGLEYNSRRILRKYASTIRPKRVDKMTLKTTVTIKGKTVTENEMIDVLQYMKKNKLPLFEQLFFEILRGYVSGTVDINERF